MMDIDHILTEMISDETAFNKVHLGQEVRRRIAVKDDEIERQRERLKVAIQAMQDTKWNMENDFGRCGTAFIDEALRKIGAGDV